MTFLNPLLAIGAAAFAIPLIIHILNRSRFRTVEWGAMHLLDAVVKVNHKRFRLDQLILLLVRCTIPVILALTLAGPILTGFRALRGASPASIVIVLDNSYSMDTKTAGRSRYDDALETATQILANATRGSEISVIFSGGKPTTLLDRPAFDPDMVARRLSQGFQSFGASDLAGAIDLGLSILAEMTHPTRELIVISDFQTRDTTAVNEQWLEALRSQRDAIPIPPELTLFPVGTAASANLSIDSIEEQNRAIGVGQAVPIRAVVRNHGQQPVSQLRVVLRINGEQADVSTVSLPAEGTAQVLFAHTFEAPGSQLIEVVIDDADPLPTDNVGQAAMTVWDRLPVLLIDGDQRSAPLQSETDYVSIALTPHTLGRVRIADLVETQTITPRQLDDQRKPPLKNARVAILANVKRLSDSQLRTLLAFVENGGSLIVTPGNQIDLRWYRESLFDNGNGLLPAPFARSMGTEGATGTEGGVGTRVVNRRFDYPGLEYFNDPAHGGLGKATIRRWYTVDLSASISDEIDRPRSVAARFDTGDPFLLERPFGSGTVLQWTTPCDADWSDLPLRPSFVPLIQQLVTTLASRISPPRNIVAGAPATAILDADDGGAAVTVEDPIGRRATVGTREQSGKRVATYESTQRPGTYQMTTSSGKRLHFAVSTPRDESTLPILDEASVDALATRLGAKVFRSSAEYLDQDRLRRHGRDLWKWFLTILVALLFVEVVLEQRFARVHG